MTTTHSKEQESRLQQLRTVALKMECAWHNISLKARDGNIPDEDDIEYLLNDSTFAVMLVVAVTLYETIKDE